MMKMSKSILEEGIPRYPKDLGEEEKSELRIGLKSRNP